MCLFRIFWYKEYVRQFFTEDTLHSSMNGPFIRRRPDQAGDDEGGWSAVSGGSAVHSYLAEGAVKEVLVQINSCTLYAYIVNKFMFSTDSLNICF